MLSGRTIKDETYVIRDSCRDYKEKGGEKWGHLFGPHAQFLGLDGTTLTKDSARSLFDGIDPTDGSKLIQSAGKDYHQPGYSLVASPPEDFSSFYAVLSPSEKDRFETNVLEKAAKNAWQYAMKPKACFSQVGKSGSDTSYLVPCEPLTACVSHTQTRPVGKENIADSNPHVHIEVYNAGRCPDGKTRALSSKVYKTKQGVIQKYTPIFAHLKLGGSAFRYEVSHLAIAEFGVAVERHEKLRFSQQIKGMSRKVAQAFSERSRGQMAEHLTALEARKPDILKHPDGRGFDTPTARRLAAFDTRRPKAFLPWKERDAHWDGKLRELGITNKASYLAHLREQKHEVIKHGDVQKAVQKAVAELGVASFFYEKEVIERVLNELAPKASLPLETLLPQIEQELENKLSKAMFLGYEHDVEKCFTTHDNFRLEGWWEELVDHLNHRPGLTIAGLGVSEALQELSPPQFDNASKILSGTAGQLVLLEGPAGSGKTKTLEAIAEAAPLAGVPVLSVSGRGHAIEDFVGDAETIQKLNEDLEKSPALQAGKHHAKHLAREALGLSTWKHEPLRQIEPNSLILVDDATGINTRDLYAFVSKAAEQNATLVLSGDTRQIAPYGHAGAFASATRIAEPLELSDTHRQKTNDTELIAKASEQGNGHNTIQALIQNNAFRVRSTAKDLIERLRRDWVRDGRARNQAVIVEDPEARLIVNNALQREQLKRSSRLGVFLRTNNNEKIYRGSRIRFDHTVRFHQARPTSLVDAAAREAKKIWNLDRSPQLVTIRAHSLASVVSINHLRGTLRVKLDSDGKLYDVPIKMWNFREKQKWFPNPLALKTKAPLSLAYALPIRATEGREFRHVKVLGSTERQSSRFIRTALTRATHSSTVYALDAETGRELAVQSRIAEREHRGLKATDELKEELNEARRFDDHHATRSPLAKTWSRNQTREFAREKIRLLLTRTPGRKREEVLDRDI